MQADIGLIGLAVMGQNLVLNMESRGYSVAVYNRTAERTREFMDQRASGKRIVAGYSIEEFLGALKKPRAVMIMVKAGGPVDQVIDQLAPHMDKGDILIDGGNSFFQDTIRRTRELEAKGLRYIGTGVSGGEEGALHGPSIMPGGTREAYDQVGKILVDISAKVGGDPCCTYIGSDGAGHYVKMVHNGIEYGDMQLIGEAYMLMKDALGMSHEQMQRTFSEWNKGELDSYLIEITADILSKKDPDTGEPLVEMILDKAGQKGTGKWTSQSALDLGISTPTVAEAVFARCISAIKEQRAEASSVLSGPKMDFHGDKGEFVESIRQALYASKICSYAQGFSLMQSAAQEYGWDLKLGEIAMIWRGGCIIRAKFLGKIKEAYDRNPSLNNLLMDPYFSGIVQSNQARWRQVVSMAIQMGVPVPAFSSAITYFDAYRSERLWANMIQAQRDYFGAHTYQRVDREGSFHTEWMKI
ncbi:MAG: NADP-dependent phosphogluconate dehydrogenase [Spirochaetales bacterium]|nr:NADP-dependent phosphogluconate dehydrogenase [Spirochaetales bacterium]